MQVSNCTSKSHDDGWRFGGIRNRFWIESVRWPWVQLYCCCCYNDVYTLFNSCRRFLYFSPFKSKGLENVWRLQGQMHLTCCWLNNTAEITIIWSNKDIIFNILSVGRGSTLVMTSFLVNSCHQRENRCQIGYDRTFVRIEFYWEAEGHGYIYTDSLATAYHILLHNMQRGSETGTFTFRLFPLVHEEEWWASRRMMAVFKSPWSFVQRRVSWTWPDCGFLLQRSVYSRSQNNIMCGILRARVIS